MQKLQARLLRLRTLAFGLAASVLLVTSGCFIVAAGAAGAGTVAYIRGELDSTLNESYGRVIDAANGAVEKLELVKISEAKDAFTDILTARTAEDKKVVIKIEKQGDKLTKVEIRIGVFGDEPKSRAILEKINSQL